VTVMPWIPMPWRVSFTSSSLKGFTMASIFFSVVVDPSESAANAVKTYHG